MRTLSHSYRGFCTSPPNEPVEVDVADLREFNTAQAVENNCLLAKGKVAQPKTSF